MQAEVSQQHHTQKHFFIRCENLLPESLKLLAREYSCIRNHNFNYNVLKNKSINISLNLGEEKIRRCEGTHAFRQELTLCNGATCTTLDVTDAPTVEFALSPNGRATLTAAALAVVECVLAPAVGPHRAAVVRIVTQLADVLDHHVDAVRVPLAEVAAAGVVGPRAAEKRKSGKIVKIGKSEK